MRQSLGRRIGPVVRMLPILCASDAQDASDGRTPKYLAKRESASRPRPLDTIGRTVSVGASSSVSHRRARRSLIQSIAA